MSLRTFTLLLIFSLWGSLKAQETAFYPMPQNLRDFEISPIDLQGNELLISETLIKAIKSDTVERVVIIDFSIHPETSKKNKNQFNLYAHPELNAEETNKLTEKLKKLKLVSPLHYPIEGAIFIQLNNASSTLSQQIKLPNSHLSGNSIEKWTQNYFIPFLTAYYKAQVAESDNQILLVEKLENINWEFFSDLPIRLTQDESFWLTILENQTDAYPLLFLSSAYTAVGNTQKASEILELTRLSNNYSESEQFFIQTLYKQIHNQLNNDEQKMDTLWLRFDENGDTSEIASVSDKQKNSPEYLVFDAVTKNRPIDSVLLNNRTFYPYLYLSPKTIQGFEMKYFTEKSISLLHSSPVAGQSLIACYFAMEQPLLATLTAAVLWRNQVSNTETQVAVYAGLSQIEMNTLTFYFPSEIKKKSKDYLIEIEKLEMEQFEKEN